MQPQPRAYLNALRREIRRLAEPAGEEVLADCADLTAAQIAVQLETLPALLARYRAALAGAGMSAEPRPDSGAVEEHRLLTEAVQAKVLSIRSEAAPDHALAACRPLLEAAAVADEELRQQFMAAARAVLAETPSSKSSEWTLSEPVLQAWLVEKLAPRDGLHLARLQAVQGVHAKEIYFLDIGAQDGVIEHLVMRRDRPIDVTGTKVSAEYELMRGLYSLGLQVPEPICAEHDESRLGGTALVMRRAAGREVKPIDANNASTLYPQIARFLSALHSAPLATLGFAAANLAQTPLQIWRDRIEHHYDWWQRVRQEPCAVVEWARLWLLDNVRETADAAVAVHGDFSFRNLLIEDGHLSVVLDWELAHIGHPAEDLGYFRADAEAGSSWDQFLAWYRDSGGREVTAAQIRYFQIWGLFRNVAINANVQYLFCTDQTRDFYFGFAAITEYPKLLTQLTAALVSEGRESHAQ